MFIIGGKIQEFPQLLNAAIVPSYLLTIPIALRYLQPFPAFSQTRPGMRDCEWTLFIFVQDIIGRDSVAIIIFIGSAALEPVSIS
jgi:hypothetical protein